ncbi:MAG: hypothetical protein ACRDQ5_26405 [Sciscionella sp.]
MGFFGSKDANARLRAAHKALDENSEREDKAGATGDTETFHQLNAECDDARKAGAGWLLSHRIID